MSLAHLTRQLTPAALRYGQTKMIISHRLKFVFFRTPKTGSTTAEFMLRLCGAFDDNDVMTVMPNGQFPAVNMIDGIEAARKSEKVDE